MEVYVYVDYRENKETGEIEFECPEVYGSFKDAQARYKKATSDISASITPVEDVNDFVSDTDILGGTGDYFLLDSDLRHICIYFKKVVVK